MMSKDDLPPVEFDEEFDGYGFFDPRAFWETVAATGHARQPAEPSKTINGLPINAIRSEK
jgi:hypothetical protein